MENLYAKACIRTNSGIYINVFEPTLEMLCIEDIAHSLSNQCRFGGHLNEFHTVAQHCTESMKLVSDEFKFEALMHDASEAYLLDFAKPIKDMMPEYKKIEHNLMIKISEKFGFNYPLSADVKKADAKMLEFEWEQFMLGNIIKPDYVVLSRSEAKENFLKEYYKLKPF